MSALRSRRKKYGFGFKSGSTRSEKYDFISFISLCSPAPPPLAAPKYASKTHGRRDTTRITPPVL
jgi:hypothetical protein